MNSMRPMKVQGLKLLNEGLSVPEVSRQLSVAYMTVRNWAIQARIRPVSDCVRMPTTSLAVLKELLDSGDNQAVIARRQGISRERVRQVCQCAIAAGFDIPAPSRGHA